MRITPESSDALKDLAYRLTRQGIPCKARPSDRHTMRMLIRNEELMLKATDNPDQFIICVRTRVNRSRLELMLMKMPGHSVGTNRLREVSSSGIIVKRADVIDTVMRLAA